MPRKRSERTEWIIYWDDSGKSAKPVRCCAVGSKAAAMCNCPMLKSFTGTYAEVRDEVAVMNEKYKIKLSKNYTGR